MYYYIKGKLVAKDNGLIVVDAGGVGYQLYASMSTVALIGEIGDDVTAYAYLYVREGIMDLYGFYSQVEKEMFISLINISGVGPKAALSILSVAEPSRLTLAILTDDYKLIQSAQGIGAKTAQRVVLELKDKLKTVDMDGVKLTGENVANVSTASSGTTNEAISALVQLGFSEPEARGALRSIDPTLPLEEIITKALFSLGN